MKILLGFLGEKVEELVSKYRCYRISRFLSKGVTIDDLPEGLKKEIETATTDLLSISKILDDLNYLLRFFHISRDSKTAMTVCKEILSNPKDSDGWDVKIKLYDPKTRRRTLYRLLLKHDSVLAKKRRSYVADIGRRNQLIGWLGSNY